MFNSSFACHSAICLQVGRDRRAVMRQIQAAFKNGSGVQSIQRVDEVDRDGKRGERFYCLLYQALYLEAEGDGEASRRAMLQAKRTPYAQNSGDYMAAVASIHCQRRQGCQT